MNNVSWFMKYKPKSIDDLVFDTKEFESLVKSWIDNKCIPGNVIFFGKPGTGKSSTAHIIIKNIITNKYDFKEMETRTVKELDTDIIPFIEKASKESIHKIVLIEEIDKLSREAIGTLKTKTLENYQNNTIVIATTNTINTIDEGLLQRFTFKIPFFGKNIDGAFNRLNNMLKNENAIFDEIKLKDYVMQNIEAGIRELVNQLQMSYICNNKNIDFDNIKRNANIEGRIIYLTLEIIDIIFKINIMERTKCAITPFQSNISQQWEQISTTINNNYDINYQNIYERLYESKPIQEFNPIRKIVEKYHEETDRKKYQHAHFISCIYEIIKCVSEVFIGKT